LLNSISEQNSSSLSNNYESKVVPLFLLNQILSIWT
jgi:hypothetical protein